MVRGTRERPVSPRSPAPGPATGAESTSATDAGPPREALGPLFWRFLKFGLLAWGGPVAQIAMIRRELVDEERWISPERFNRVFAVYQVLPGPEAHELCVYFGMQARGRIGGVLAGLGFMLPGFVLMFLLSWAYVTVGAGAAVFAAVFYGTQPAIAAAVARAVQRIGRGVLHDRSLWALAGVAAFGDIAGMPFLVSLPMVGMAYVLVGRKQLAAAAAAGGLVLLASVILLVQQGPAVAAPATVPAAETARAAPSLATLFGSGLRSGLLTFGGAYTVIPFLQHDAVLRGGGWMTNDQFLDGLALSGILPAPLIIFATFVGYLGGGPWGAVAVTVGIFLPAFAFTLVAHDALERLVARPALHTFLSGVTAGVVGLIAVTAVRLARVAIIDGWTLAIFAIALTVLYRWHAKLAILVVVAGAGIAGWLVAAAIPRLGP